MLKGWCTHTHVPSVVILPRRLAIAASAAPGASFRSQRLGLLSARAKRAPSNSAASLTATPRLARMDLTDLMDPTDPALMDLRDPPRTAPTEAMVPSAPMDLAPPGLASATCESHGNYVYFENIELVAGFVHLHWYLPAISSWVIRSKVIPNPSRPFIDSPSTCHAVPVFPFAHSIGCPGGYIPIPNAWEVECNGDCSVEQCCEVGPHRIVLLLCRRL